MPPAYAGRRYRPLEVNLMITIDLLARARTRSRGFLAAFRTLFALAFVLLLAGGASTGFAVQAALVIAVIGVLMPLANAILTKPSASDTVKSIVSVFLAGLGAVSAALANVHGTTSVKGIVIVFVGGAVAAGGLKWAWLEKVEDWLRSLTGSIGIG